jgi:iron-sulfur cluster repair protein YtfE (RIC family)
MTVQEVVDRVVQDHAELRDHLRQWESGLAQLGARSFLESKRGLRQLRRLVPLLDKELPRHFRTEEEELFPNVEARHPDSAPALVHFLGEHADLARRWKDYKQELLYCDAVGETERALEQGTWLVAHLRQHMQAEQEALLPLVEES